MGDDAASSDSPPWRLVEEETDFKPPHRPFRPSQTWPWKLSTLVFGFTTVFLFSQSLQSHKGRIQYLETDLTAVQPLLSLETKRFSGALTYNESGSLVREHQPGQDVWVGDPSPDIDRLWDRVEAASTILLQGQEAGSVRDRTTLYDGYWMTGLDVIHQMHCLNMLRKALYPDHYKPHASGPVYKMHWEHCLDYVRQAIMCSADITPLTNTWHQSAGVFGPDFETRHTCRNFDAVLEWGLARTASQREKQGRGSEVAKDRGQVIEGERLQSWIAKMNKAKENHGRAAGE